MGVEFPRRICLDWASHSSRPQAPDGRNTQGTGLGLALTKSFAEMHGGYLSIESEVKVGTTVSIYLPVPSEGARATRSSEPAAQPVEVAKPDEDAKT